LVKKLKTSERKEYARNHQLIKRPNLIIMGIEEGKEAQAKGIHNIFNKNNRKFPKPKESYAHSGTGSLQDTKQT
jgi:hypothetical protein